MATTTLAPCPNCRFFDKLWRPRMQSLRACALGGRYQRHNRFDDESHHRDKLKRWKFDHRKWTSGDNEWNGSRGHWDRIDDGRRTAACFRCSDRTWSGFAAVF